MAISLRPHLSVRRASPCEALWLSATDPVELVNLFEQIYGPWPELYRLADGFIVVPAAVQKDRIPGTLPLRRIAGHLYLPSNAELVPAFSNVEAADYTSKRGLLFLPHQTARSFDPNAAIQPSELLELPSLARRDWLPLPDPPPPDEPDEEMPTPDAIIGSGAPEPGEVQEEVRPAKAPPPTAVRRTRSPSALSRGSTTRSAPSNAGPTTSGMQTTCGSKSSPACSQNSKIYPQESEKNLTQK